MPEGIAYVGSNSTFTGPSNSLITVGDHAYAFGGKVDVTTANEQLLGFQTGKKYLRCRLQVSNSAGSGDDIRYTVLLNGVITCEWYYDQHSTYLAQPLYLVIPPYTTVAIHGDNQASSTPRAHTCWLEGKVYG
jgi:hypothetical protein